MGLRGTPRIHDVRVALNSIDADVVFLQEVQDRNDRLVRHAEQPAARSSTFLHCADLRCITAYGKNAVYPHGHHGNAIVSRHADRPVRQPRHLRSRAREARACCTRSRAAARGARGNPPDQRALRSVQAQPRAAGGDSLIDFVRAEVPPRAPLIIAGDFNDWQQARRRWFCVGDLDVCRGGSATSTVASSCGRRFDRVLPWRRADRPLVARTYPSIAAVVDASTASTCAACVCSDVRVPKASSGRSAPITCR